MNIAEDKQNRNIILENRKTEWLNLRSEISHQDGLCQTILAFLMTVSMTSYTLYFETTGTIESTGGAGGTILLGISSAVWLLGYYYLLEKRFFIGKIAYYLRTKVEQEDLGLYYENWVFNNRELLKKRFLRKKPYKIETVFAIGIILANLFSALMYPSFITHVNPDFLTRLISAGISLICLILTLIQARISLRAFNIKEKVETSISINTP